ncbi:hypothetical protein CBL_05645 [Carabus blaptoides fortunei]
MDRLKKLPNIVRAVSDDERLNSDTLSLSSAGNHRLTGVQPLCKQVNEPSRLATQHTWIPRRNETTHIAETCNKHCSIVKHYWKAQLLSIPSTLMLYTIGVWGGIVEFPPGNQPMTKHEIWQQMTAKISKAKCSEMTIHKQSIYLVRMRADKEMLTIPDVAPIMEACDRNCNRHTPK